MSSTLFIFARITVHKHAKCNLVWSCGVILIHIPLLILFPFINYITCVVDSNTVLVSHDTIKLPQNKFGSGVIIDQAVLGDNIHRLASSQLPDVSGIMFYASQLP